MEKTASEMFKALGYTQVKRFCGVEEHRNNGELVYEKEWKPLGKAVSNILTVRFDLKRESYTYTDLTRNALITNKEMFLAIKAQFIELGWLDEPQCEPSTIEYAPEFVRECEKRGGDVE